MRTLLRLALCTLVFLPVAGLPVAGQADDRPELAYGRGVMCDTAAQAERFVRLYEGDVAAALAAVNEEFADPTACGVLAVGYRRGAAAQAITTAQGRFSIVAIEIAALLAGGRLVPVVPPVTQFAVFPAERDA